MIEQQQAFPSFTFRLGSDGTNVTWQHNGLTKGQWIATHLLAAYISATRPMSSDDIMLAVMLANRATDALLGTFQVRALAEEIIDLEQQPEG